MQVTVQKLSPVLMEFDVQIDATRVSAELEKSFVAVSRNAKIRGFRPGKAPRQILTQVYGSRIASEVAQRLVDETFPKAVSDNGIQPVSAPAIEPQRVQADQPFTYKARFEILPEIAEVNWEGLLAKRPKVEVSDEAVDKQLERVRSEQATLEPLPDGRSIESGDVVLIDFVVEVAGKVIKDAGATGFQVEVGSGRLLKEIETAVLGARAGAVVSADVPMPKGHAHPKLRGKTATFKITITEAKTRVLPAADDELAKDAGDFENLEALRAHLRGELEKAQKEQSENSVAEQLVSALVQKNEVAVPNSLVEQQMNITKQEILQRARMSGNDARGLGDELMAQVRADSEMKVKAGLLMAEIAKKSQIKIGEPEIEDALKELADQAGKPVAKMRAEYADQKRREMLIGMILENKVLDLIESKATIEDA
ncbi:MAG TPA: trigger factor [Polyangiaceae bacterium]